MDGRTVPLRTGPPTRDELLAHYPPKFTWNELKTFINAGDLGLLKRHKKLQARYIVWFKEIQEEYGSVGNYLEKFRLQWGKPDTLSLLRSSLDDHTTSGVLSGRHIQALCSEPAHPGANDKLPTVASCSPAYFTASTPPELISIIQNDWPYSVPLDVEHTLIWTRIPIINFNEVPPKITTRLRQDGLWGFTGSSSPPPSPSTLPSCLPALADWGITMDKLLCSPKGTEEEEEMVRTVGSEVDKFVRNRWVEKEWETAWFVNPPRIQSVPDLSHIHVFARRKPAEEIANG